MRNVLVAATAVIAGCLFPSLSGFSDSGDAGDDVSANDGPPPAEGGLEGDVTDAPPDAGFDCSKHAFCDDFSTGEVLGAKWSSFSVNGVTFTLDTAAWTSPPSSLLAVIPPNDGGVPTGTLIENITPSASAPHLQFDWDMRLDAFDTSETGTLLTVFDLVPFDPDFEYYDVSILVGAASWGVNVGGAYADGASAPGSQPTVAGLAANTWRHVTVDVFSGGATPSWAVSFDGASVATGQLPSMVNVTGYGAAFGVPNSYLPAGTAGWSLRFDNFTYDALTQ